MGSHYTLPPLLSYLLEWWSLVRQVEFIQTYALDFFRAQRTLQGPLAPTMHCNLYTVSSS